MKKYSILTGLLVLAFFTCGFNWGFGSKDKCGEASRIVQGLSPQQPEAERLAAEKRIMELCPGGAPGKFVAGQRLEREGKIDEAAAEYREALKIDPGLTRANGSLGLIYLQKGLADEAVVNLTKGLSAGPDPRLQKGLGEIFNQRELYSLSLYYYDEAVKGLPDDAAVHAGLADTCSNMGLVDRAEEEYKRAIAIDSNIEGARQGLALIYLNRKELDKAAAELKKAIAVDPKDADLHKLLGEVYEKKGDKQAAEDEYRLAGMPRVTPRAEEQKPADLQVTSSPNGDERLKKGKELFAAKEYEKALAEFQSVSKDHPNFAEAHQRAGECLQALGRNDEAIAAYREAIRNKAENADLHYNLGVLYERKEMPDEAVVEFKQSLNFGENGDARRRLADIYSQRGIFPQAIEQYRELLKTKKDDPVLHLKLARVLFSSKNYKDSIAEYQEAVALEPDNLEAHRELAGIFKKRGMTDDAEKQYREVLRLKKDDSEARNALLAIYVEKKKYNDVLALLKEGVELNPKDANSHYKLGLIYEFNKDYESAIASYKATVELNKDHAKALNALGRVYMKTGRYTEAKEALEAARTADPNLEETKVLLNNIQDELSPSPGKHGKSHAGGGKKHKKGKKGKGKSKGSGKKSSGKAKKHKKG